MIVSQRVDKKNSRLWGTIKKIHTRQNILEHSEVTQSKVCSGYKLSKLILCISQKIREKVKAESPILK